LILKYYHSFYRIGHPLELYYKYINNFKSILNEKNENIIKL